MATYAYIYRLNSHDDHADVSTGVHADHWRFQIWELVQWLLIKSDSREASWLDAELWHWHPNRSALEQVPINIQA